MAGVEPEPLSTNRRVDAQGSPRDGSASGSASVRNWRQRSASDTSPIRSDACCRSRRPPAPPGSAGILGWVRANRGSARDPSSRYGAARRDPGDIHGQRRNRRGHRPRTGPPRRGTGGSVRLRTPATRRGRPAPPSAETPLGSCRTGDRPVTFPARSEQVVEQAVVSNAGKGMDIALRQGELQRPTPATRRARLPPKRPCPLHYAQGKFSRPVRRASCRGHGPMMPGELAAQHALRQFTRRAVPEKRLGSATETQARRQRQNGARRRNRPRLDSEVALLLRGIMPYQRVVRWHEVDAGLNLPK